VDEYVIPGAEPESWVQTASVLHSNGDAFDVAVQGGNSSVCVDAPAIGSTGVG